MTRVLVIDDEHQIGSAIRSALERRGDEVLVAHTGAEGLEMIATTQPDLLVLDLHLPDRDGTEIVRRVRPWYTDPILVLSGVTDERSRVEALDAGADDFLAKPFGLAELQARLRALQRRVGGSEDGVPTQVSYGDLRIDLAARSLSVAGREVLLTPTEWRLLVAFVGNPSVLLTHQQLIADVWSQGYGDESRQTLRAHIRSLRSKIGDPAAAPVYIRTENRVGYRWVADSCTSGAPRTAPEPASAPVSTDVVHDLSNVITSLRLAVDLAEVGPSDRDEPARASELLTRVGDLVDRAAALVAELETEQGAR